MLQWLHIQFGFLAHSLYVLQNEVIALVFEDFLTSSVASVRMKLECVCVTDKSLNLFWIDMWIPIIKIYFLLD